jgi:hypothetical protein
MSTDERIQTYEQFWPYYLREHSKPSTRALHYVGSTLAVGCLGVGVATLNPLMVPAAAVCGYGFAWLGHFVCEKNRPATFTYPTWSLYSDFRMYTLWLRRRLAAELDAAGVGVEVEPSVAAPEQGPTLRAV